MNFFVKPINMGNIRAVIKAAIKQSHDNDVQLSILSRALITAAKTIGVPKATVIRELEHSWDETKSLQELNGIIG